MITVTRCNLKVDQTHYTKLLEILLLTLQAVYPLLQECLEVFFGLGSCTIGLQEVVIIVIVVVALGRMSTVRYVADCIYAEARNLGLGRIAADLFVADELFAGYDNKKLDEMEVGTSLNSIVQTQIDKTNQTRGVNQTNGSFVTKDLIAKEGKEKLADFEKRLGLNTEFNDGMDLGHEPGPLF